MMDQSSEAGAVYRPCGRPANAQNVLCSLRKRIKRGAGETVACGDDQNDRHQNGIQDDGLI